MGCCCGATKSSPCACMKQKVMKCSKTEPKCPCYTAKDIKKSFDHGWSVTKWGSGGFKTDECQLCGEVFNDENISYESKQGNAFCKGCYKDRKRIE